MKNNLILFLIFLLGFSSISVSFSQSDEGQYEYDYWAKKGIVEVIYVYMEDLLKQESLSENEILGMEDYKKEFIIKYKSNYNSINLKEVSDFLKKNYWSKTESNLFKPLCEKFDEGVQLDSTFFSLSIIDKKPKNWILKVEEIIDEYNNNNQKDLNKIDENEQILPSQDSGNVQTDESDNILNEETLVKRSSSSNNLMFYFLIFFAFIIGWFLNFLITRKRIYSILIEERQNYFNQLSNRSIGFKPKFVGLVKILKERKDFYKSRLHKVNIDVQKFSRLNLILDEKNSEIEKLRSENTELKLLKFNENSTSVESSIAFSKENTQESVTEDNMSKLYFNMPEFDGSFRIMDGDEINDGKKYFKIEYRPNSHEGEVIYIPGMHDSRAINQLEDFLKPVCEIQNFSNLVNARNIEFLQAGRVRLNGDRWVIEGKNKIKIKLY